MTKIRPTKTVPRFEKYNCTGKLRVDIEEKDGDIIEIQLFPKGGGCRTLQQAIGKLTTGMLECNIDPWYIVEILESVDPCHAVKERPEFREGKIERELMGFGGCPRIVAQALREKLEKIK